MCQTFASTLLSRKSGKRFGCMGMVPLCMPFLFGPVRLRRFLWTSACFRFGSGRLDSSPTTHMGIVLRYLPIIVNHRSSTQDSRSVVVIVNINCRIAWSDVVSVGFESNSFCRRCLSPKQPALAHRPSPSSLPAEHQCVSVATLDWQRYTIQHSQYDALGISKPSDGQGFDPSMQPCHGKHPTDERCRPW